MKEILFVTPEGELYENAFRLFADRWHGAAVHRTGGADIPAAGNERTIVSLSLTDSVAENGYIIRRPEEDRIAVSAADALGLYYAVGRLLHSARQGEITAEDCAAVPEKKLRGIYFATHFHNYYHDAPVEEICTYMEDLLLWGCNTVAFWFDMHHYTGIDDPEAVKMIDRLTRLAAHAKKYGMKISLTLLANEYYSTSPAPLRASYLAEGTPYRENLAGHFHVELCPSREGAMELLLRSRREMFHAFRHIGIDYICIWPYDQGGCTCEKCRPWGGNGFLRIAQAIGAECRSFFPQAKIILSTWLFDRFIPGEWEALYGYLEKHPGFYDYILSEPAFLPDFRETVTERGTPGGLPLIGFPEISMAGCVPWGGFGANVKPARTERLWKETGALFDGGFPYSEGIFEDVSKVLYLQLYSGGREVREILEEYISYEFPGAPAEDVLSLLYALEKNDDHVRYDNGVPNSYPDTRIPVTALPVFRLTPAVSPDEVSALAEKINGSLSETVRNRWRWKLLYYRARCDKLLSDSEGTLTPEMDAICRDLVKLYHAGNAAYCVSPVTYEAVFANRGDFTWG